MRLAAFVLFCILATPAVVGHGEVGDGKVLPFGSYLQHIESWNLTLAPQSSMNQTLAFGGAPLEEDWFLMFHAVSSGNITARLDDDAWAVTWNWTAGINEATTRLQHTGWPTLTLTSLDDAPVLLTVFFDQTCDCIGKSMPEQAGPLLFNIEAKPGDEVRFDMTMVPVRGSFDTPDEPFNGSMIVQIDRIRPSQDGSFYETLQSWNWTGSSADWQDCRSIPRFHACIDVRFTAEEPGQQVVVLRSWHDMPDWSVQVRPILEVAPSRDAPLPTWAATAALVAAFAFARSRRPYEE
ncbi:MAG: hypothetical protein ACPHID_01890 [Thermoplasmatota archaeon]